MKRHYYLSYIEWVEYENGSARGYDRCHSFEAATDAEAREKARELLIDVKTSGPRVLRCVTDRFVKL